MAVAEEHGLRVGEPVVLNDLFSLMVHLAPAPVVARVATWAPVMRRPAEDWLRREVEVTGWLAGQGAPVVSPSAELPAGPHERDGFAISFWTHLRADPDRTVGTPDCAAMLADLHAALRGYPGELPLLAPAANEIPRGLAALDADAGPLTPVEADRLRAAADRLRPFWQAPPGPLQPLHGDAHPGNIVATADGLVWIDFEDVCTGPVEWDLALLHQQDPDAVAAHHRCDPETMARCSKLRALHVALCLIAYRDTLGDTEGWDAGIRYFLNALDAARPAG